MMAPTNLPITWQKELRAGSYIYILWKIKINGYVAFPT